MGDKPLLLMVIEWCWLREVLVQNAADSMRNEVLQNVANVANTIGNDTPTNPKEIRPWKTIPESILHPFSTQLLAAITSKHYR